MGTGHWHLQMLMKEKRGLSSPAYHCSYKQEAGSVGKLVTHSNYAQNMAGTVSTTAPPCFELVIWVQDPIAMTAVEKQTGWSQITDYSKRRNSPPDSPPIRQKSSFLL